MAPKFGTSGLRGLVTDLTDTCIRDYTRAYLSACPTGGTVFVGYDLRASSPRITETVVDTCVAAGQSVITCGALPTPALALAAAGHGAIMVTGSHIPADRNGLKFYRPEGEITKDDEAAMLAALGQTGPQGAGHLKDDAGAARAAYTARYRTAFGPQALTGLRIGVYQHSSVARDIMVTCVEALGGVAVPLGRSDVFVPVDTEAVDPATGVQVQGWCRDHGLDAVISTDGDADRPMLADATGALVPGDVLGVLTAQTLQADIICTPVSSNTMVDHVPAFSRVRRTRIGSPYVIAAMEAVTATDPAARVVGYEPNGGFLLGYDAHGPAGPLPALMTRDCLLPMLAPLAMARRENVALAALRDALPQRFTASNRLTGIASEKGLALVRALTGEPSKRSALQHAVGLATITETDVTDGLRMICADGVIAHVRPSGNAPEFRCYAEADTPERAQAVLLKLMASCRAMLTQ